MKSALKVEITLWVILVVIIVVALLMYHYL